jgi:hypothetical protein
MPVYPERMGSSTDACTKKDGDIVFVTQLYAKKLKIRNASIPIKTLPLGAR